MTTTLQQLSPGQANQELRINELIESLSAAGIFSKKHSVTTGLVWGYYGGRYNGNTVADGSVTLTASTTNYVVALRSTGVVSTSTTTTNYNNTATYARLYQIVTGASTVTSVVDGRMDTGGLLNGGGSGSSLTFPFVGDATNAGDAMELYADGGSTQPFYSSTTYSASNALAGGGFHSRSARGTKASPTALQSGDLVGGFGSRWCYTAGTFHTSSPVSIHPQVTENQTSGAWGSWWRFLTTPKGSTTRQERGGWTDNGTVWCHDNGTFDATLDAQTLPVSDARFVASASTGGASFAAVGYGTDVTPVFRGMAANGTPASPSAIPADRLLNGLAGMGFGTTAFSTGSKALIGLYSSQTWTDANQGTYIELKTTPNGSTTLAARVRIPEDGGLAIQDGITAPATLSGWAKIYVDTADGDLKVKFGDGTVKTIVVDT